MSSRIRFWGTIVTTGLVVLFLVDIFSLCVLAAETSMNDAVGNDLFIPIVLNSETVIPTPIIPPDASYEDQVMILTNQERLNHGCEPLVMDDRLRLAAEGHSQDMAIKDYFSHYSPDGTTP